MLVCILVFLPACGVAAAQEKQSPPEAIIVFESTKVTERTVKEKTEAQTSMSMEAKQEPDSAGAEERINAPVSRDIAQIVAFYNKHANLIKAVERIGVTRYDYRDGDIHIPTILRRFMPDGIEALDLNVEKTITEEFVNGIGTGSVSRRLNDFMPVNGAAFASKLKPSHVSTASRIKQEDGWLIRIHLKNESIDLDTIRRNAGGITNISEVNKETLINDILLTSGYGSCMDMGFSELILGTGDFDLRSVKARGTLENGRILAHVNEEDQLTSLTLSFESYINISFWGMKIKMSSASKQEYRFTWNELSLP